MFWFIVFSAIATMICPSISISAPFNCAEAKSYSEKIVCDKPEFSAMDVELNIIYQQAKWLNEKSSDFERMATELWSEREECVTEKCVRTWYSETMIKYTDMIDIKYDSHEIDSAKQQQFMSVIKRSQAEYKKTRSELDLGGIQIRRDDRICDILKDNKVTNWSGKIKSLGVTRDGKGVLAVEMENKVTLRTWSTSYIDIEDNTLIEPVSKLFKKLSNMGVGDSVIFSGYFVSASTHCLKETSLTLDGGLPEPEFLFKFSDVKAESCLLMGGSGSVCLVTSD